MKTFARIPRRRAAAPIRAAAHVYRTPSSRADNGLRALLRAPPAAQRLCAGCNEELQRVPATSARASGDVSSVVAAGTASGGTPLPTPSRQHFEPRFGHDFGQVRVHTDAKAAESARAVNALAYTMGQDVVFGAGGYAPGTTAGDRLLAHELTHVVQQTGAIQRQPAAEMAPSLRPLVEIRLEAWKRAAETGVENFADAELSRQIEESQSFDTGGFLTALVGNVIWAAACFTPVGLAGTAFVISLGGIAVGVRGTLPESNEPSQLMQIKRGMQRQLDEVHRQALAQVAPWTDVIVALVRDIDIDQALERLMLSYFRKQFLTRDSNGFYTEVAEEEVRWKYESQATITLRRYVNQVAAIGRLYKLIRIEGGGLAIAQPHGGPGRPGPADPFGTWSFIRWVGQQMTKQALLHAAAQGWQVPTVKPERVWHIPEPSGN